jgi:thiamine biosynthesis lipoprotein
VITNWVMSAGQPKPRSVVTELAVELRDHRFEAMGCACQIMILGGSSALLGFGENRVRQLEDSWTRFDSESELAEFNARAGRWNRVSPDLLELLVRGLAGWRLSQGMFSPFLGEQIVAAGYGRDFAELTPPTEAPSSQDSPVRDESSSRPGPSWYERRARPPSPLLIRRRQRLALIDPGVAFDSGGIGKGLGADMVATALVSAGATGAMVSLGGDIRVAGSWPDDGWRVGIVDPTGRDDHELSVVLRDGALCTSGTVKRRWRREDGGVSHHILDPRTGSPLEPSDVVAVSAIARQGWRAEVLTKMVLLGGTAQAQRILERKQDVAFLTWDRSGSMSAVQ